MNDSIGTCPQLSVIIPVYNSVAYLDELLESIESQDLDSSHYEVLLVDDGSTDGSAELLDRFCSTRERFSVIHQENSGWPGIPRNRGLEKACGNYVFFVDSDDVLAINAFSKMTRFAESTDADIVFVPLEGTHGRSVARPAYFQQDVLDVSLEMAFKTLGPIKMYRRSLLIENDIRFPVENVRLEDGIFNAYAYLAAKRISSIGGDALYFVRSRDDGENISIRPLNPEGYTWSTGEICRIVAENRLPADVESSIVLGLFRRKCLKIYRPERYRKYSQKKQEAWIKAHRGFQKEFVPLSRERNLPYPHRQRSSLIRLEDREGLLALGEFETEPTLSVAASGVKKIRRRVGFEFEFEVEGIGHHLQAQMICELRRRGGDCLASLPARRSGRGNRPVTYIGTLNDDNLSTLPRGVYDLYMTTMVGDSRMTSRVGLPTDSRLPKAASGVELYQTRLGNLSLKIG